MTEKKTPEKDKTSIEEVLTDEAMKLIEESGEFPKPEEKPDEKEQKVEPETETTEKVETETETTEEAAKEPSEWDKFQEKFKQSGFDRRYTDPNDMLDKVNSYITRLEQQRAEQEKRMETILAQISAQRQPEPETKVDPEQLIADPMGTLSRLGYVKQGDVERTIQEKLALELENMRVEQFTTSHSDFNELEPAMVNLAMKYPAVKRMPPSQAVALLYDMAKTGKPPKTVTEPVPSSKKERATTSGGKSTPPPKAAEKGSVEYMTTASLEQIEKDIGFGDE